MESKCLTMIGSNTIDKRTIQATVAALSLNGHSSSNVFSPLSTQLIEPDFEMTWCDPTNRLPIKSDVTQFTDFELMLLAFFKCPAVDCSFYSNDRKRFAKHLKKHENSTLYCLYCDNPNALSKRAWPADEQYVAHLVQQHGRRRFQCNKCVYRTRFQCYLEVHMSNGHPRLTKSRPNMSNTHFEEEDCVLQASSMVDEADMPETEMRRLITARQKERTVGMCSSNLGRFQCLYCEVSTHKPDLLLLHMTQSHLDSHPLYMLYCDTKKVPIKCEPYKKTNVDRKSDDGSTKVACKDEPVSIITQVAIESNLYNEQQNSNQATDNDDSEDNDEEFDDQYEYCYFDPNTIERPQYAKVLRTHNPIQTPVFKETESLPLSAEPIESTSEATSEQERKNEKRRLFNIGKRKRISHLYKERQEAMMIDEMEIDVTASRRNPSNTLNAKALLLTNRSTTASTAAISKDSMAADAPDATNEAIDSFTSETVSKEVVYPIRKRPQRFPIPTSRPRPAETTSNTSTATLTPNLSQMSLHEKLRLKTIPVPLNSNAKSTKGQTGAFANKSNGDSESFGRKCSSDDGESNEFGSTRRRRHSENGKLQRMREKCGKSFAANTNLFSNHKRRDDTNDDTTSLSASFGTINTGKMKNVLNDVEPKSKRPCAPSTSTKFYSTTSIGNNQNPANGTRHLGRSMSTDTLHSKSVELKYFCLFCEVHSEQFKMMHDHVLKHLFDYQCTYCTFSDGIKEVVEQHQLIRHNETKKLSPNAEHKKAYLAKWAKEFLNQQHVNSELANGRISSIPTGSSVLQCPICIKSAIITLKLPRTFESLSEFKEHFYTHSCWEILVREAALNDNFDNASSFLKSTIENVKRAYDLHCGRRK